MTPPELPPLEAELVPLEADVEPLPLDAPPDAELALEEALLDAAPEAEALALAVEPEPEAVDVELVLPLGGVEPLQPRRSSEAATHSRAKPSPVVLPVHEAAPMVRSLVALTAPQ